MKTKKNKINKTPLSKSELVSVYQTAVSLFKQYKPDISQALAHIEQVLANRGIEAVESALASLSISLRKIDKNFSIKIAELLIEKVPRSAAAHLNLAYTYEHFKDYKSSAAALQGCLKNKPMPDILVKCGALFAKYSLDKEAIECVKKGYALSGQSIDVASATLRVALKVADWETANQITSQLKQHYSQQDFNGVETPRTHLLWCADEALNIKVLSKFAESNFPARDTDFTYPRKNINKTKLRIGFISYDFREHATSHLALGLLRHFNDDRFEYFAYCTSWDDGSAMRRDILNRFTKVKTISNKTDKEAAQIIHADRIDILVDFNGLTEGTRMGVLAFKPAPIQISYLGFPGTCGGRYIDYVIADDYTLPAEQNALYPEKIIRIPPTYQMNDYDAKWLPPKATLSKTNLPEGKLVLGMFNNVNKITDVTWSCWMKVLASLPDAVLWMLDPGELARNHLLQAAQKQWITQDKIIFAPKLKLEAHFARLQLCDFVLDPWPYGGHTTTADALFCGVPAIVLEGCNFASRVSGGLLKAAGLEKLIAKDQDAYIKLAVELGNNKQALASIKTHLNRNRKRLPVFNAKHRTQQIERAFLFAYNRFLENRPAVAFRVV